MRLLEEHRIVAVVSLAKGFSLAVVEIVTENIVAHSETDKAELYDETCTGSRHLPWQSGQSGQMRII